MTPPRAQLTHVLCTCVTPVRGRGGVGGWFYLYVYVVSDLPVCVVVLVCVRFFTCGLFSVLPPPLHVVIHVCLGTPLAAEPSPPGAAVITHWISFFMKLLTTQ